jgi:phosphoribosylanthranilate isomerase
MFIKICGLRTEAHALVAAEAGADLIGLNFVSGSRRQVSVDEAAVITAALTALPAPRPRIVGLFVNTPAAQINAVADRVGLDLVQLSGDERIADAAGIGRQIIKSIRLDGSAAEAAWLASGARILVDAHVAGAYGGTGARADWAQAAALAGHVPFLLAGGLTPENVAEAIALVRPWGVDVSSGVEEAGAKSPARIRAFIAAARGAARP